MPLLPGQNRHSGFRLTRTRVVGKVGWDGGPWRMESHRLYELIGDVSQLGGHHAINSPRYGVQPVQPDDPLGDERLPYDEACRGTGLDVYMGAMLPSQRRSMPC